MIKNILSTLALTAFFVMAIIGVSTITDSGTTSIYARTTGSPGSSTGSPADNMMTCNTAGCHTGSVTNSGSGTVSIIAPALSSGYVAGTTYSITARIAESGINKFGFEATVEKDSDNSKIGTLALTNSTTTKFTNSNTAVTHNGSAGTTPSGTNTTSWSFDWTAPVSGSGDVTFYAAFNSANGSGSAGDKIYTDSLGVSEALPPPPVQAKVIVNVQTNSFTPNSININVGDTVEWTNTGGSHNVNGTTVTYPSNPESFGNSVGTGWTFSHVFNTAGNYDYRCDPHFGLGMIGTITVGTQTSVVSNVEQNDFNFYPNPVISSFQINTSNKIDAVKIYNLAGNQITTVIQKGNKFDVTSLSSGIYFVNIVSEGKLITKKIIKK